MGYQYLKIVAGPSSNELKILAAAFILDDAGEPVRIEFMIRKEGARRPTRQPFLISRFGRVKGGLWMLHGVPDGTDPEACNPEDYEFDYYPGGNSGKGTLIVTVEDC